jgi:hypothetical protein
MVSNSQEVFFDPENPEILRALVSALRVKAHTARKLLDLLHPCALDVIARFVPSEAHEEFYTWAEEERQQRKAHRRLTKKLSSRIAKRQARMRVARALR